MRYDVVTIFPEYLEPLRLSLLGKAQEQGIVDIRIHHLRDYAFDRHKTVDDTPYGGGAGMVMKAEPWALALEEVLTTKTSQERPLLLVPSPAGVVFNQRLAEELSEREHLVFAPARYEGIDERVFEWAEISFEVMPVSLGDYVLYGGEVAVLTMIEAITRLLPGAMGNPQSLEEESHTGGLLEYPVYTKPSQWRGHHIPDILLSGNHAAIARWRRDEQLRRTFTRRYDMIESLSEEQLDTQDLSLLQELREQN
ncbi:tRNA (guanosine(37)-N1)-methyltransferase TrmD [Rothia sp. P6271]|uniref:tRNA (guanosine(37)-N1)-methyltransferase TrmD n=1 Tax=Rothia sp. P6271 TaxID=3402659 RepID=UPI003ABE0308